MKTRKFFKFFLIFTILESLVGCRTVRVVEQVPVEVHDTAYVTKMLHDSTYIDRWHTEYIKGDTVYVTNNETKVVYKYVTDTSYKYVEKPVTVTKTERVEVKKPLSWWVKTQIYALWAILAVACVWVAYRVYKRKKL